MSRTQWKMHKFGGSSLADASCFERVSDIVLAQSSGRTGVVVSAMGGMTNQLLGLIPGATHGDDTQALLNDVGRRYADTAKALLSGESLVTLLDAWNADSAIILDCLNSAGKSRNAADRASEIVSGFGELWSARLLASLLTKKSQSERNCVFIDAREIVFVRHGDLGPSVIWDKSQAAADRVFDGVDDIAVITGFIASDQDGQQTTLGRNGSDFSAAIFAALTGASRLDIWTDVDGVMSADPRRVPDAEVIHSLSYDEAMELAYFGARVIHPQTLGPVVDNDVQVWIRNSFAPEKEGSRIGTVSSDQEIKGITAVDNMALINLEGAGMIGVPGTANRLFGALRTAGVSVTLISQASSEHSICVAVPADLSDRAQRVIAEAFADELTDGQIQSIDVADQQSILAVVGDGMAGMPGIAARFFGNLGRAGINVRAIAQGSSERNISAVIDSQESTRALRAVHSGFYLSAKTVSVGIIGTGVVGGELLQQMAGQGERLRNRFNLDLRVRGIARSRGMLLAERAVDSAEWQRQYDEQSVSVDLERFADHVHADHLPHAVIIDCTADEAIAEQYAHWLGRGVHLVTPNKKGFSNSFSQYRAIQGAASAGGARFLYETTVGAALPIIKTVRDLVDSGDRIHSLKGILSGTLAYLFNVYDGSRPFSEIVRDAREQGFTEPDPRDDLSGMDVARKLTILAREMGLETEIGDFPVESLVPEALQSCGLDEYLERLPEFDADMTARLETASAEGKRLRYIASLDGAGNAAVELCEVTADDPFSNMQLTDNLVQFQTDRYVANPLVIQGPGAGPAVTAGGVFGDLLTLVAALGDH